MSTTITAAPKQILIAGGGYGGLAAAVNLLELCVGGVQDTKVACTDEATDRVNIPVKVTIVDERDGFYHLIGSPLALSSKDYAIKAWIQASQIPALQHPSIDWVHGSVKSIDPLTKTAKIARKSDGDHLPLSYDYFVAATGLRRVWPTVPQSLSKSKYLRETDKHIVSLQRSTYPIVIVGGGCVGVEMAAELRMAMPSVRVILAHSRTRLLSSEPLPEEVAEKTLAFLVNQGVDVRLNHRLINTHESVNSDGLKIYDLGFSGDSIIRASHVISAISRPVPSTSYLPTAVLNEGGFVVINSHCEFAAEMPNRASHFAVGDLAAWSGIKRCGAAMYGGTLVAHNVYQHLLSTHGGGQPHYRELSEMPPMIALALGKEAIAWSGAQGLKTGDEVVNRYFGKDLGLEICLEMLGLKKKRGRVTSKP